MQPDLKRLLVVARASFGRPAKEVDWLEELSDIPHVVISRGQVPPGKSDHHYMPGVYCQVCAAVVSERGLPFGSSEVRSSSVPRCLGPIVLLLLVMPCIVDIQPIFIPMLQGSLDMRLQHIFDSYWSAGTGCPNGPLLFMHTFAHGTIQILRKF